MRRCVSMAAALALARVATVGCADIQLKLGGPVELQALTTKGASICGIPACLVGFESVARGSSGRALVAARAFGMSRMARHAADVDDAQNGLGPNYTIVAVGVSKR